MFLILLLCWLGVLNFTSVCVCVRGCVRACVRACERCYLYQNCEFDIMTIIVIGLVCTTSIEV